MNDLNAHIVTSRMTGKTVLAETTEVGIYTIICTCGWRLDDVRGYKAMADASDAHKETGR